ncbi:DUF4870 domain-containing protein [Chitinophaga polysaccharea]|uniref:DUF4870 domain-containing protein n=1 Tax=Chitinophaga polysaccharea TaxID=1293035 RepID=UPI00115C267B|nr:DUF4870 domain-containing protein [Chitinophaga polysaccharea]
MDKKTLAIISYITIIGWLIAFFRYKDKERDPFVTYHLKQSLGIAIISLILGSAINIIAHIIPSLSIIAYANIAILALWVAGIINAMSGRRKAVPVVGPMFGNKFSFLM